MPLVSAQKIPVLAVWSFARFMSHDSLADYRPERTAEQCREHSHHEGVTFDASFDTGQGRASAQAATRPRAVKIAGRAPTERAVL